MSQDYIKVFSGSSIEILPLREALEAENIIPVIKDRAESARLAGFGALPNFQDIFVHKDELECAQKLIADHTDEGIA